MITISSPFNRMRFVAAVSVAIVLTTIIVAAALLSPDRSLAQTGGPDQAKPDPVRTSLPPSPPPALQLNPPTATPEPGAIQASPSRQAGNSNLEVVRFRPDISLRRGESPLSIAAEKPDGAADSSSLKRPAGETGGPQESYQALDIAGLLSPLDWNLLVYEDFEGVFPGAWILEDFSDDSYERTWGDNNYISQSGFWSAWPAAGGADRLDPNEYYYPNNLDSWMEYGPLDFSNMADVFVSFGLWYETEPQYDWVYFCASIDFVNYNCDYWSGDSDGWTDQAYWLTSYAGYSEVWLAWVFQSDSSIVDDGPFVDEIYVWGYDISVPPPPPPTPDPDGELIQNGSFETGDLTDWESESYSLSSMSTVEEEAGQRSSLRSDADHKLSSDAIDTLKDTLGIASVGVTDATAVDGQYSAYLWQSEVGNDFLYQTINVPSDVTDVVLNFWFGVTTYETDVGNDWFCVSMSDPADHSDIWVDLGCMDAYYTTGYWQEVLYNLDASEISALAGKSVDFVFELYNRGGDETGTAGWVDYVRVYATGGGSAGDHIDPNEPNDDYGEATPINCGDTISGTIGDAMGSYGDVDWFRMSNVPSGQLDIDIKADTQVPPSALDSVVSLWDSSLDLVTWNDDDGISYDSYITYTNPTTDSTFYIRVESYSGYGGPDSFYDLTVQCGDSGSGPPPGGNEQPPENTAAWTVMLYLNAEDRGFEPILRKYISDIEQYIGSKNSFLNVVVLFDGPGDGDTWRYLVQPNGAYTNGTNRWHLGELNMGDPDTLANFGNWAMDQYPAENYYLAIDDHGHGVYGISWDSTDGNDALTPPELYSALKDITNNGSRKIDIFDYEACLMGMAENAYDVREWVDYVVFFEQISWGLDTYPRYFNDLAATHTPLSVGTRIINRYHTEADNAGYPHTISLIDTAQMAGVKQATTALGDALQETGDRTAVNNRRSNAQAFAADNDATNPVLADYIDLWDLADKTASLSGVGSAAAQVETAVENAVVIERHSSGTIDGFHWDHSGVHGLSIYYPASNASSAFRDYTAPRLFKMSTDESDINGRWDEFLSWAITTGGNGAGNGLGGDDRRGMTGARFLQPKLGGSSFVYLPLVLRQ